MKTKKLISKYLAALWLFSVVGFLALQTTTELQSTHQTKANDKDNTEFILVSTQSAQTLQISPDLKILPAFLFPVDVAFRLLKGVDFIPGFVFHPLQKEALIELLKPSISINAP